MPEHVFGHFRFGNLDSKHQEFLMHARRAPEGVVLGNAPEEISHIPRDPWPAAAPRSGSPSTVEPETPAVPAYERIWLECSQCVDAGGPQAGKPQEMLSLAEANSPLVPVHARRQLLPQRLHLQMETSTALEYDNQR